MVPLCSLNRDLSWSSQFTPIIHLRKHGRSDPYDPHGWGLRDVLVRACETKNNPKPSGDVKIAIENGNL